MQDKFLHVAHSASNEAPAPEEPAVLLDEPASTGTVKPAPSIETELEMDRVAIYLKGPTAFSA